MVTNKNLIVLYNIVQAVNAADLPGDIVECGVWRGGSAAMMARANLEDRNRCAERRIWLFDSFQGLPPPGKKDGEMERKNYFEGWNRGSTSDVRRAFDTVGVPLDGVEIVPGWFNVTLGRAPVDRIAVLHIDADWYDSTKLVLDALYDKVIPGGFIILNDYGAWPGCNRALADFFQERALGDIRLHQVEPDTGAYFKKP